MFCCAWTTRPPVIPGKVGIAGVRLQLGIGLLDDRFRRQILFFRDLNNVRICLCRRLQGRCHGTLVGHNRRNHHVGWLGCVVRLVEGNGHKRVDRFRMTPELRSASSTLAAIMLADRAGAVLRPGRWQCSNDCSLYSANALSVSGCPGAGVGV